MSGELWSNYARAKYVGILSQVEFSHPSPIDAFPSSYVHLAVRLSRYSHKHPTPQTQTHTITAQNKTSHTGHMNTNSTHINMNNSDLVLFLPSSWRGLKFRLPQLCWFTVSLTVRGLLNIGVGFMSWIHARIIGYWGHSQGLLLPKLPCAFLIPSYIPSSK